MSVKFTQVKDKIERKQIRELYNQIVAPHEKSYFYLLWWKRNRKNVSFLNIYDKEKWVGWIFYSEHGDLIKITLFATIDHFTTKQYGNEMFDELKRLYPNYRIVMGVEIENPDGKNKEKAIEAHHFYKTNGFGSTKYFIVRDGDSFEFMVYGGNFKIEEHYAIDKELYPLIGKSLVKSMEKQIQIRQ